MIIPGVPGGGRISRKTPPLKGGYPETHTMSDREEEKEPKDGARQRELAETQRSTGDP